MPFKRVWPEIIVLKLFASVKNPDFCASVYTFNHYATAVFDFNLRLTIINHNCFTITRIWYVYVDFTKLLIYCWLLHSEQNKFNYFPPDVTLEMVPPFCFYFILFRSKIKIGEIRSEASGKLRTWAFKVYFKIWL